MMDYIRAAAAIREGRIPDQETRNQIAELLLQCSRTRDRETPRISCRGAQDGLDKILRGLLPKDPVVYVDVGASEPIECSNTYQFYAAGGRGLLIEPMPFCWYPILLQRPRDQLYPKAVAATAGWAKFHLCGACSSLDPKWTSEKRGEIAVQTEPLGSILSKFEDIRSSASLCSIDTEGTEEAVIASVDWSAFRPRIVVVEYKIYERQSNSAFRENKLKRLMEPRYQCVHRDNLNLVFQRKG